MQINDLKRKLLYNLGINRSDICHYKAGRFDRIAKKKLKQIKLVAEHEIIEAEDFSSLKQIDPKYKYIMLIYDLPKL